MMETHGPSNRSLIVASAAALVAMLYFVAFVDYGLNLEDEGTLLYQIERTADGQVPYTDFHIGYTPAVYYLNAAIMRAGDYNIVDIRWTLAAVNSLSVLCLVLIAARFLPLWMACLPALYYAVSIPVHPGEFAAFNIPYPVWYNVLFFAAGLLTLFRFADSGRLVWLAAAGLLAGLDFMFKPNAGLFHIAAASFAMLAVVPMGAAPGWKSKLARACWWALWIATLAGTWGVFAGKVGVSEVLIYLLPVTVMALVAAWRSSVSASPVKYPGVVSSAAVLLGSFIVVNLPWMLLVISEIGLDRFLVKVLFLGADFEKFYYIAHPPVLTAVIAGLVGVVAVAVYPRLVSKRWLQPDCLCLAALLLGPVAAWLFLSRALMPEGFLDAVKSALQSGVFSVTLIAHWVFIALSMRTIGTDKRDSTDSARYCIAALAATFMYLQLYPRTDYMHWVTAAPLSLVLGATLLAAVIGHWSRQAQTWGRVLIAVVWLGPVVVLMGNRALPAVDALASAHDGTVSRVASVTLDNERAPVSVNFGRARRYGDLAAVARFIRQSTVEGEEVFTFPALDIVSFLSDRHNPTRHGYFFPRWPGRDWEAEVVAYLMEKRPRFTVVLHDHAPFFSQAPIYYFAIGDHLEAHYRPYKKIGRYMILARKDAAVSARTGAESLELNAAVSLAPQWLRVGMESGDADVRLATVARARSLYIESDLPMVTRALFDEDHRVRDMAVWALRYSRDPTVGDALSRALRSGRLSPREQILAAKTAQKSVGARGALNLLTIVQRDFGRLGDEARTALFYASTRALAESYWFGARHDQAPEWSILKHRKPTRKTIVRWLGDDFEDHRLRRVAIWLSRYLPEELIVDELEGLVSGADVGLKTHAYHELMDRGRIPGSQAVRVGLLTFNDMIAPRALRKAMAATGEGDWELADALKRGSEQMRHNAGWIAGARGGRKTVKALASNLDSPDPLLRKSAIWGLHLRGRAEHLERMRMRQFDSDFEVREFADRAVAALSSKPAGDGAAVAE